MATKVTAKRARSKKRPVSMALAAAPTPVLVPLRSKRQPVKIAAVYALTIFLGAFLLFQVQLILGRFVLPRFGGGPSVWSASLLTFQCLLLGGYGYAAILRRRFSRRIQAQIHFAALAVSALGIVFMIWRHHSPILPLQSSTSSLSAEPVLPLLFLLVSAVGLPCVLLSASSPLLQSWFSQQSDGASPYRLYALSNLGSMLGLLSYPFALERVLGLSVQSWLWAGAYVCFLGTTAYCAWLQRKNARSGTADNTAAIAPQISTDQLPPGSKLLWLSLSACASVMLLATTNLICQEVATIPLLWVLPLSLYLLSFIVCFDHARWYRREIFQPLFLVLALVSLRTLLHVSDMASGWPLVMLSLAEFALCMVCHGELARLKPDALHLTSFYLTISAGGALGSAFVVLVAPQLFSRYWEFQIALIGCGVLLAILLLREPRSWVHQLRLGRLLLASSAFVFCAGAIFYTVALRNWEDQGEAKDHSVVWRERNFFGAKTVLRYEHGLVLRHGRTIHGAQGTDAPSRDEPTMYYRRESGIGLLLDNYPLRLIRAPLRLGVIGMGAGTLAAYSHPGDSVRFYEIDPDIVGLSQGPNPLFTFVKDSPARTEIVTGDARILLQQELAQSGSQKFDVLAVDAFSGDAIPVHLLTREAMALYLRHLHGPASVIAFHVSNRNVDLHPVVAALAREFHLASVEVFPPGVSDWILLCADPMVLRVRPLADAGHPIESTLAPQLWTDDYSNLYSLVTGW